MSIEPNSTSAQLKNDISSGRTGDKVGGFDPGAAPLGTDDEAGGYSPTPQAIAEARSFETGRGLNSSHANAAEPALQPDGQAKTRGMALSVVLGIGAAAALAAVLVALL